MGIKKELENTLLDMEKAEKLFKIEPFDIYL